MNTVRKERDNLGAMPTHRERTKNEFTSLFLKRHFFTIILSHVYLKNHSLNIQAPRSSEKSRFIVHFNYWVLQM